MSLEKILDQIRESAEQEAAEIRRGGEREVEALKAEAAEESADIRAAAREEAAAEGEEERRRILGEGHLEAQKLRDESRQMATEAVLDLVRQRLEGIQRDDAYQRSLPRVSEEALAAMSGSLRPDEEMRLLVAAGDQRALHPDSENGRLQVEEDENLGGWGGVRVLALDGSLEVDNRLEARLERARPYLRRVLPQRLEEEG